MQEIPSGCRLSACLYLWLTLGSFLFLDGPWVLSAGERDAIGFFDCLVFGKHCQNNCKMIDNNSIDSNYFNSIEPLAIFGGAPPSALSSPQCATCCMPPGVGSCPLRLPLDQPRHYLLNSLKLLAGKPPSEEAQYYFLFFSIMTGIFAMAPFHGAR